MFSKTQPFNRIKNFINIFRNKILINYLETKYLNTSRGTKQVINNTSTQKTILNEKQIGQEIRLPGIDFKEGFSNVAIRKLEQRAKENFYDEIIKEKQ